MNHSAQFFFFLSLSVQLQIVVTLFFFYKGLTIAMIQDNRK